MRSPIHTLQIPAILLAIVAGCGNGPGSMTADGGNAGTAAGGGSGSSGNAGSVGTAGAAGSGTGSGGSTGAAGTGSGTGGGGTGAAGSTGVGGSGAGTGGTGVAGSGSAGRAGGGGNNAGSAGTSGSAALTLTGLKIEANPKNVLSCFVSWTTTQAATSVVQFGAGKYEWEIADANPVTAHRVLVIGMHAQQAYLIKAISTNTSGSGNAEGTFTAGTLPASIPVAQISVSDPAKTQPGWTLMNVQKGDGSPSARSTAPAQAVMYDAGGKPVWYFIEGTTAERGGAISVDLTDKGVLIGGTQNANLAGLESPREVDFAGNTLWQCTDPSCGGTGNLTHHVFKLPNGNYVMNRDVTSGSGTSPVFEERSPANQLVWSLNYKNLIPQPSGTSGDWCHGNSITVNMAKNEVYANCRWIGLIKTTYTNPTLIWHIPAKYGAQAGTITFSPAASQFMDAHDPEIHDDGTILFFDNGGFSGAIEEGNPGNRHSRAVEYKIDDVAKTATLVWEFPGTFNVDAWYKTTWYTPFWGDADRLANGNVMITAGMRGAMATSQSRVFEVTKADGKVVWELRLPPDHGVYRAERITPPLIRALAP